MAGIFLRWKEKKQSAFHIPGKSLRIIPRKENEPFYSYHYPTWEYKGGDQGDKSLEVCVCGNIDIFLIVVHQLSLEEEDKSCYLAQKGGKWQMGK